MRSLPRLKQHGRRRRKKAAKPSIRKVFLHVFRGLAMARQNGLLTLQRVEVDGVY